MMGEKAHKKQTEAPLQVYQGLLHGDKYESFRCILLDVSLFPDCV